MSKQRTWIFISLFVITGLIVLVAGACDEKDVPFVVDEDEIGRYIRETEIGRELFRQDSLILPDPYTRPGDTTLLSDTVIGIRRTTSFRVSGEDEFGDYGPIGQLREALAVVADEFTVVTRKLNEPGAKPDTTTRYLTRLGLFVKLGDDSQPFVGWILWGFNSLGTSELAAPLSIAILVRNSEGSIIQQFPGDGDQYAIRGKTSATDNFSFVRVSEIPNIADGVTFEIEASIANASIPTRFMPLLTASYSDRIHMVRMNRIDRSNYADTVITPNPDPRLWNLAYFQAFNDTTGAFARSWCVPYRIPK